MTPAIGADSAGTPGNMMQGMGGMLAAGQPPPPGAAMDAQIEQNSQAIGQIRAVGQQLDQLAMLVPAGSDLIQQIQQQLKQLVLLSAQGAPQQTASSMAVPGGGAGA